MRDNSGDTTSWLLRCLSVCPSAPAQPADTGRELASSYGRTGIELLDSPFSLTRQTDFFPPPLWRAEPRTGSRLRAWHRAEEGRTGRGDGPREGFNPRPAAWKLHPGSPPALAPRRLLGARRPRQPTRPPGGGGQHRPFARRRQTIGRRAGRGRPTAPTPRAAAGRPPPAGPGSARLGPPAPAGREPPLPRGRRGAAEALALPRPRRESTWLRSPGGGGANGGGRGARLPRGGGGRPPASRRREPLLRPRQRRRETRAPTCRRRCASPPQPAPAPPACLPACRLRSRPRRHLAFHKLLHFFWGGGAAGEPGTPNAAGRPGPRLAAARSAHSHPPRRLAAPGRVSGEAGQRRPVPQPPWQGAGAEPLCHRPARQAADSNRRAARPRRGQRAAAGGYPGASSPLRSGEVPAGGGCGRDRPGVAGWRRRSPHSPLLRRQTCAPELDGCEGQRRLQPREGVFLDGGPAFPSGALSRRGGKGNAAGPSAPKQRAVSAEVTALRRKQAATPLSVLVTELGERGTSSFSTYLDILVNT